jgi:hypothetical protein
VHGMMLPKDNIFSFTNPWHVIFQHIKSITFTNVTWILNMHRILFFCLPLLEYYKEDCPERNNIALLEWCLFSAISNTKCKEICLSKTLYPPYEEEIRNESLFKYPQVKQWSYRYKESYSQDVSTKKIEKTLMTNAKTYKRSIKNLQFSGDYYTIVLE